MTLRVRRKDFFKGLAFSILSLALAASPLLAARNPVVRIIVVDKQSEAENILAEIGKGRSFASLAKERSVDEKSRDRYGEITAPAFESLDERLKEAALKLSGGEVSRVIALGDNRRALVLMVDMAHYRKGAKAFRLGDFKAAERDLLKHVELNPDAVKARVILGRICEAGNEVDKAEAYYKDALRFDLASEEAYERLGALYLRMGKFQQANDLYVEGVHHLPDSKSLRTAAGKIKKRISYARTEPPKKETAGNNPGGNAVSDVRPLAPSAKATPPEEVAPLERETGTPEEKSAVAGVVASTKATSVNSIELRKSAEGLKVMITGDGVMSPNVFALDEKIVIDIPNVSMHALLPSSVVSPLKGIRAAKHRDKVRLVLELKGKTAFDVATSGNTFEVFLKIEEPPAAPKETVADGPSPKESAKKGALPGNSKEKMPEAKGSENGPSISGTSKNIAGKKIHIRIIFADRESDAQDILSQVKKGRPFALLARERSADEKTRETYGYLGEVSADSLHTSIQDALSKLKEGQTSEIIKIDRDRYAIVQVTQADLYRDGEKAFIAGDYPTAEGKLLTYVESNPDAAKALAMLGKIYEDRKEPSKAIEMYKKAIEFSPKTVLVYERLARVYLFLGMYQKAKDVYIRGLRQVPSSPVLEEGIEMADLLLIGDGERTP